MKFSLRTQMIVLLLTFGLVVSGLAATSWVMTKERAEESVYRPVLATKDLVADALPPPLYVRGRVVVGGA